MRNFVLRCLFRPAAEPIVLDPYEIELATSPCLYSVSVEYDYLEDSYANYHEYAIMDMLAGATPSLREINLFWRSGGSSPWLLQALRGPRHRYQRGSISGASSPGLGSLKSLNIVSNDSACALRQWSSVTDFSSLESLTVHYHLEDEALLWLSSCRLSSLRQLSLSVEYGNLDTETTEAVETLITSLPFLDSLKLPGPLELNILSYLFSITVDTACDAYSYLVPKNNPLQRTSRKTCPQVEELALCIMRSQGDANEVAIYHALGGFRHVRKMHLAVYCPQPFPARFESIVEFENFYTGVQVTDKDKRVILDNTLINFAFDRTLARSIFRTISMSKAGFSPPLIHLSLRMQKTDGCNSLVDILTYIGRSWTCIRNDRDDRPHECFVSEYDHEETLDREYVEEHDTLSSSMDDVMTAQAVYRVWPEAERGDWKKKWHSFPLAGSSISHDRVV
ncbi:hypothetical protein E4T52_03715 [Aureobasidium sp. EXF-3400]|nr:hypothetical protein E4T52_03715 [Aureobasidium sp. EXF-3400]